MGASKAIASIVIIGQGLRGWWPAAYLAARFPDGRCQINVVETGAAPTGDLIVARPSIRRFHQLLQMPERALIETARAQPSYGVKVEAAGTGSVFLPYGRYGIDHAGAEFHQYWSRAFKAGKAGALGRYNLGLRLAEAGAFLAQTPKGLPAIDYGYVLSRSGYCALLRAYAEGRGVLCTDAAEGFEVRSDGDGLARTFALGEVELSCDMVIDARMDAELSAGEDVPDLGWRRNWLRLPCEMDGDLPDTELYSLVSALDRLIALWPDMDFLASEQAEYNRLTYAECDRVLDMKTLLKHGVDGENQSDALVRKIKVFAHRGRIAAEDHDVFTRSEWLAALTGCGIVPARYDRLADRMSLDELARWLGSIEGMIERTVEQAKSAARVA